MNEENNNNTEAGALDSLWVPGREQAYVCPNSSRVAGKCSIHYMSPLVMDVENFTYTSSNDQVAASTLSIFHGSVVWGSGTTDGYTVHVQSTDSVDVRSFKDATTDV